MRIGRFDSLRVSWITLVALAFVAGAIDACSDNGSSPTGTVLGTIDSGAPLDGAKPSPVDSGGPGDAGSGDAANECGMAAKLHPPTPDGGIYCPFSAADGGKNVYCTETQTCCETPSGTSPSTCVAGKTDTCPVAKSTAWQCEDPADCPSGQKCCAHSGDAGAVTVQADVCGPYLSKFSGTRCASACSAGELVVCEEQAACPTGTCTAVKPKGNDIGVCR